MRGLLLWAYWFAVLWFMLNLAEGTIELLGPPELAILLAIWRHERRMCVSDVSTNQPR